MRELAVSFWGSYSIIILEDWITDRRPTAKDANLGYVHVPWECVAEGVPWKHSAIWRPATEKPALAVGQTWRRRDGKAVTITKDCDHQSAPLWAYGIWYERDGKSNIHDQHPELELVELIPDAAKPEPTPRRIVAISTAANDGEFVTTALADDGTAWWTVDDEQWTQLPPLPPIEERH